MRENQEEYDREVQKRVKEIKEAWEKIKKHPKRTEEKMLNKIMLNFLDLRGNKITRQGVQGEALALNYLLTRDYRLPSKEDIPKGVNADDLFYHSDLTLVKEGMIYSFEVKCRTITKKRSEDLRFIANGHPHLMEVEKLGAIPRYVIVWLQEFGEGYVRIFKPSDFEVSVGKKIHISLPKDTSYLPEENEYVGWYYSDQSNGTVY